MPWTSCSPRKLIPVAVRLSGIAPDTKVNQITREERESWFRSSRHFR